MGEYNFEDYRKLVHAKSALVYYSLIPQGDFNVEDMEQEAYFIFLNAVRTFDPSEGQTKFEHYLWSKLHWGFKDYFRKLDYLPRGLGQYRTTHPQYMHAARLESVLDTEEEWGLPESLKVWDDHTEFEELDIVERFWDEFLEQLPYNHRVAFNVWRQTGHQEKAAQAAGLTGGRMSQLMKKLDAAAKAYGERLRKDPE